MCDIRNELNSIVGYSSKNWLRNKNQKFAEQHALKACNLWIINPWHDEIGWSSQLAYINKQYTANH